MDKKNLIKHYFLFIFSLSFGGLFIYASLHKISSPLDFAESIFRFQIVPDILINIIALFLPWLELLSGIFLIIFPPLRRGALTILSSILALYTLFLTITILRGIHISCGCFSANDLNPIGWHTVIRNLGLFIFPYFILRWDKKFSYSMQQAKKL